MNPLIKRGWLRALLYLFALIITIGLFTVPGYLIASLLFGETDPETIVTLLNTEGSRGLFYQIIVYLAITTGVTVLTYLFRTLIDRNSFSSLGFELFHMKTDILIGVLTGFTCLSTAFIVMIFAGLLKPTGFNAEFAFLIESLLLFILVSWLEELSFRGYILKNLKESFGRWTALIISSIVFALFHSMNTGISSIALINLMLAGMLLGIATIYTGTIWYAIGLHLSWNFFQGPVFGFSVSGIKTGGIIQIELSGKDYLTGGDFGFEGSVICSILLIFFIIILDRYFNKRPDHIKEP